MRKDSVQETMLGKLDIYVKKERKRKKKKWDPYPYITPYTKIHSKWVKDLNLRPKTVKLLDENRENLLTLVININDFLAMIPKAQVTKEKNRKLHPTKEFLHIKGNNQQNHKVTYKMGANICKPRT